MLPAEVTPIIKRIYYQPLICTCMEITRELIQKFFENKCDPDEFEAVMNYWQSHPEQAAQDLGIKEWNETDPLASAPENGHAELLENSRAELLENGRAEMLEQLKDQLFRQPENPAFSVRPFIRRFYPAAIAASLLLAVAGLVWIRIKNTNGRDTGPQTAQQAGNKNGPQTTSIRISRVNHTGKPLVIQLPDGSSVKLYDQSSLQYTDSFGITERDSRLEGQAVFTVARDRNRPFTVVAGSLATTALGTSFGMTAPAPGGAIAVQLYSGRVVVRSTHALTGWNKDIYLSPGQQVLYDDHRMLATVSRFGPSGNDVADEKKEKEQKDLVFNNSSLKEVINQLSIQYHKKIIYRKADIAGMNFTGTVPRTDSLGTFLKLLGAMNNLDIQEQPPVFILSRHKD